jgi:anti-anti-sigma factor
LITIEKHDNHTLSLKGSVEHFEATQCKSILSEAIQTFSGKALQLDISGLESVSSIALSFLLFGLRCASKSSCELHYHNMPPALFNMARVSGIETILLDKS